MSAYRSRLSNRLLSLTSCMENPETPGRIKPERFILVEISRKKYLLRYYRFPVFTETTEIFVLYRSFGLPVLGFMSRERAKFAGIL